MMNTTKTRIRRLLAAGAVGAASAAVANAVLFGIGRVADLDYVVNETAHGAERIAVTDVVGFSLMSFAVGLLTAVVATWLRRPSLLALQIVGAVVAVASMAMDAPIDASAGAKVTLAAMHLVVGLAYVVGLQFVRSSRSASLAPALAVEAHLEPATV
jgi:hypothetical protein